MIRNRMLVVTITTIVMFAAVPGLANGQDEDPDSTPAASRFASPMASSGVSYDCGLGAGK